MFTTKTSAKTSTNELIRKADLQLLQLQQEIDQIQNAIIQAQVRIDLIIGAAQQRSLESSASADRIQELAQAAERMQSFADLAAGTRQEREASSQLKQAQSELSKAQALNDQDNERASREQQKEEELARTTHEHIAKKQQELNELYGRQASITTAREQAMAERGRDLKQAAMIAIQHQQERITALQQCADQEQSAFVQLLNRSTEELADYPDLAGEIRSLQPLDDATSRVMLAAMSYIDTLLTERGKLADHLSLPSTKYVTHFLSLFGIPEEELWRMKSAPGPLTLRREKLEQVLGEYRESQRA